MPIFEQVLVDTPLLGDGGENWVLWEWGRVKRDDGGIWDHVGSFSQCASPNSASLLWESGELREVSEATDLLS